MDNPTAAELEELRQEIMEDDYNTAQHERAMETDWDYFTNEVIKESYIVETLDTIKTLFKAYGWQNESIKEWLGELL